MSSSGVNPSFRHTACVRLRLAATARLCVCGRKKLPFAGYSIVKERLKLPVASYQLPVWLEDRYAVSFSQSCSAFFRLPELLILRLSVADSNRCRSTQRRARAVGPRAGVKAGGLHKLHMVENTGLEPVTSWLQTRRSPS